MVAKTRQTNPARAEASEELRELRRKLGQILKGWREDQGITQADLAAALGLKYYSFISQVENGIGRIPQDLYVPWAQALGVDPRRFCWTVLEHIEPSLHAVLVSDIAAE